MNTGAYMEITNSDSQPLLWLAIVVISCGIDWLAVVLMVVVVVKVVAVMIVDMIKIVNHA